MYVVVVRKQLYPFLVV